MFSSRRSFSRRGFTLLEVLLALALSSLLVIAVGASVRAHLRAMDIGRTDVEEAQLARSLLGYIAADLRNIVHFEPQDVSGAEAMMQLAAQGGALQQLLTGIAADSTSGSSSSGGSTSSSGGGASATGSSTTGGASTGGSSTGSTSTGSTSGGASSSSSSASRRAAGVYGDLYRIEFDVRRAPRVDEYDADQLAAQLDGPLVHTTDLRTISYFLSDSQSAASQFRTGVTQDAGLARGEMDRPSAAWSYNQGQLAPSEANAVVLAPEVELLEFRYFDGADWVEEWDSEDRGAVPLAIEISLGVRRSDDALGVELSAGAVRIEDVQDDTEWLIYRLVVQIPLGAASSPGDGLEDSTSSSTGSSSSSGASTGSSSGGGAASGASTSGSGTTGGGR